MAGTGREHASKPLKPGTRQSLKQGKPLGKIPGLSNAMHRPYGGAAKQDHGPVECYAAYGKLTRVSRAARAGHGLGGAQAMQAP